MKRDSSKHSISELRLYLDCRQAHSYRYRDHVESSEGKPWQMLSGTAIHKGLEFASLAWIETRKLPSSAEAVEKAYESAVEQRIIGKEREIRSGVLAGMDCLQDLLDDGHEILEAEKYIDTGYGSWKARGQIDLVTQREGTLYVIDWKCKFGGLGSSTALALDPQTTLYAWHEMQARGLDECMAGRVYLRSESPSFVVTKAGKLSLQSKCDRNAYAEHVALYPERAVADPGRFGRWYRSDLDYITLEHCQAVLSRMEQVASEVDEQRAPLPNFRPERCPRCEYFAHCSTSTLLAPVDGYSLGNVEG